MDKPIKIAHISDLHFSKICFSPFQFFSKRWLGTANLLLKRGRMHSRHKVFSLIACLVQKEVTDVLISGDLTTTSQPSEYRMAQKFIDQLKSHGMRVHVIPGNHDHYTKGSFRKKRFYSYIDSSDRKLNDLPFNLKDDGVCGFQLENGWWVLLLDTSALRTFRQSNGVYTPEIDQKLRAALELIPTHDPILVMNHFPFFQHEGKKRAMEGGPLLENLLRSHTNIQLYLHGHTHRRCQVDLRSSGLPIVIDSGSLSHIERGGWSLIELARDRAQISLFASEQKKPSEWHCLNQEIFHFVV